MKQTLFNVFRSEDNYLVKCLNFIIDIFKFSKKHYPDRTVYN